MRFWIPLAALLLVIGCRTESEQTEHVGPLAPPADATATIQDEEELVIEAAGRYVQDEIGVGAVIAQPEGIADDWARAEVTPMDGSMDPVTVFLRRVNGAWQGEVMGTAFSPDDYDALGIPETLRDTY